MTAIAFDSPDSLMPDTQDTASPARDQKDRSSPEWWEKLNSPIFLLALTALGGSGILLWQQAPAQTAQIAAHTVSIERMSAQIAELQRAQLLTDSELRANKEQLRDVRDSLNEIKAYNAKTMQSVNEINLQFAEIRGALSIPKDKK